jgi:hypothetical protein
MKKIINELKSIIPVGQFKFTKRHVDAYSDVLEKLKDQLTKCPKLHETDGMKEHPAIFHYFCGKTDIYICEYDKDDDIMFGFSILNGDFYNSEWGYINIADIIKISLMNIDYYFEEQSIEAALCKKYPDYFDKPSSII